jgi:hypothetical protein
MARVPNRVIIALTAVIARPGQNYPSSSLYSSQEVAEVSD